MAFQGSVRVRRGLIADLPASAPNGELLLATDTGELFYGTEGGVKRAPNTVLRSYIFNIDGEQTVTWPDTWAAAPHVTLTAVSTAGGSRPTTANIIALSGTSITIRVREIAGLSIAFRQEDVHVFARGVLA